MAHNTGVDVSASNPLPVAFSKRIDSTTGTKAVQPPVETSADTTTNKSVTVSDRPQFQEIRETHAQATSLEERSYIIRSMRALIQHVHQMAHEALRTSDENRKAELQAITQERMAAVAAAATSESARVNESVAAAAVQSIDISTNTGARAAIDIVSKADAILSTSQAEVAQSQADNAPAMPERAAQLDDVRMVQESIQSNNSRALSAASAGLTDNAASLIG